MKKFNVFVAALLLALSTATFAETHTFQWTEPTTRVNGDPLAITEIISNVIECGTIAGGPYDFVTYSVQETFSLGLHSFTSPSDFTPGTYFCRIGSRTENPDGPPAPNLAPGAYSADLSFTVVACTAETCGATAPGSWASG